MHPPPEKPHHEHRDIPELIVHQISLVSMDGQNLLTGYAVLEKYGLLWNQSGEQVAHLLGIFVVKLFIMFADIVRIFQEHVVVAVQHNHAVFVMEFLQSLEDVAVGQPDVPAPDMLGKFVSVSGFDIGVSVIIILVHRKLIYIQIA